MSDDRGTTYDDFRDAVNMTPAELERWLDTDDSRSVGWTGDGGTKDFPGGAESKGHESGRRIIDLLRAHKADLTDDDYDQMRRVTGYVHRHLAQRPQHEDIESSRWRYSLMNWGNDPLK